MLVKVLVFFSLDNVVWLIFLERSYSHMMTNIQINFYHYFQGNDLKTKENPYSNNIHTIGILFERAWAVTSKTLVEALLHTPGWIPPSFLYNQSKERKKRKSIPLDRLMCGLSTARWFTESTFKLRLDRAHTVVQPHRLCSKEISCFVRHSFL